MTDEPTSQFPEVEIVDSDELSAGEEIPSFSPADLGIELPEDTDEAINHLTGHIVAARSEADGYLDDLRRVAAEFDNFRKRAQRDQTAHMQRASERVLSSMLPVLDSFDAALSAEPATEVETNLLTGMRSTYDQLMAVLGREGLTVIDAVGSPFDPAVHEAVMSDGDGGQLVVSQELRRGYRLGDHVLRAALVALESE